MSEYTVELPCGCVAGPDGEETKVTFCHDHQPKYIALQKVDEFRAIFAEIEGYEMNDDWEIVGVTVEDGISVHTDEDGETFFEVEVEDGMSEEESFLAAATKVMQFVSKDDDLTN